MAAPSVLEHAKALAQAMDGKKGEDVVILDTAGLHSLIECFVIVTARGPKHAAVLGEEALALSKRIAPGARPHLEAAPEWVCGDFHDVVLHVFTPEARKYYDLEHLWADAPRVVWQPAGDSVPA